MLLSPKLSVLLDRFRKSYCLLIIIVNVCYGANDWQSFSTGNIQQNFGQPLSEAELYASVPADSFQQGYGSLSDGRVERIDNAVEQLPDIVEQRPTQEVILSYTMPAERPRDNVINNLKQIHDYSVQRRLIQTNKRVIHKYTKNVYLNSIYNTNVQKVNHPKIINVIQNTLQDINEPKLIVHYSRSSAVNDNAPPKTEPPIVEEVTEETQRLPAITQPAQVELIIKEPDPCGASNPALSGDWDLFKKRYNKTYPSQEADKQRKQNWACNLGAIDKQNEDFARGHQAFSMGMNSFGDLTADEFDGIYNGARTTDEDDGRGGCSDHVISGKELPASVDWRTMDIVSPVKDQEECGSCWAFSAIGALESQEALVLNSTRLLSEQRLVDCSRPQGNMGCDGGYPNHAFNYVMKNGIDTATDYPYQAINDTCQVNGSTIAGPSASAAVKAEASSDPVVDQNLRVIGCRNIPQRNELALMDALATVGPVSVCIDSSQTSFQLYSGGVYDPQNCSSTKVDHGMLAVGYGKLDGKDYWLIKNSFGPSWGVDGYLYLARGNNRCGITVTASYPVVEKPIRIVTTTTTTTTTVKPPIIYYNYYLPSPNNGYGYNGVGGFGGLANSGFGGRPYGGQSIAYRSGLPPPSKSAPNAVAARSSDINLSKRN